MNAALTTRYGPPACIEPGTVPDPVPGPNDVVVAVRAAPVTAGDRRLRAADFPSFTAVFARLVVGLTAPRDPVQGTNFAGRVVEVGGAVTRFAIGDDVFGATMRGAYAERLAIAETDAIARMPANLSYACAASLPYGAGTALHFLRLRGAVRPGDRVALLGASGGVGRYAVQVAKHLGAEVTAVCGADSAALVRELGADHVIDYRTDEFHRSGLVYDVIFDIAGASSFGQCKPLLSDSGRYLTLHVSVSVLLSMAWTSLVGGKRAIVDAAPDSAEGLAELALLADQGVVTPRIEARFPLDRIEEAHALAETGVHGEVIVLPG